MIYSESEKVLGWKSLIWEKYELSRAAFHAFNIAKPQK